MKKNLITTALSLLFVLLCSTNALQAQMDCISGLVYADVNDNCLPDDGETRLENFPVSITRADGFTAQTLTDVNGRYQFCELEAGTYSVLIFSQLGGYFIENNILTLDYESGEAEGNDFCLLPRESYGTLSGSVYVDLNSDGARQVDEPGFVHTINIQRVGEPNASSLLTDEKGNYRLDGLAEGEYLITSNPAPQGVILQNNINQNIVITNGELTSGVDYQYAIAEEFGLVSDFVCIDWDLDGAVEVADNAGIGGHQISLINAEGEATEAYACPNGQYAFVGVVPGVYTLASIDPGFNLSPITPTEYAVEVVAGQLIRRPFYYEPQGPRIDCGEVVLTCFSGFVGGAAPNLDGSAPVMAVVDLTTMSGNTPGSNWGPSGAAKTVGADWDADRMGQVFGLAIDVNQQIYAAASSAYGLFPAGTAGSGGIYRVDPGGLGVTDFVVTTATPGVFPNTNTIYNTGSGLGNIAYDEQNNQFFVTNFEDGLLYRINAAGLVQETYDFPGSTLLTGAPGFAPLGERLWAVAVYEDRVYFSVWNEDTGLNRRNNTRGNEVWSIALDGSGAVAAVDDLTLEVDMSTIGLSNDSSPISDISFSQTGEMVTGEKSMLYDLGNFHLEPAGPFPPGTWGGAGFSHRGRVLLFNNTGTSFTFDKQLLIGNFSSGENCAGGIDYTHSYDQMGLFQEENCDEYVWSTGDALRWGSFNNAPGLGGFDLLYGLAGVPTSGNSATVAAPDWVKTTSYYVDMAGGNYAKAQFGDVEVFDCNCLPDDCADENGLQMLPASPVEPNGVGDCCFILDFNNVGPNDVYGISLTLLDGAEFQPSYTIDPTLIAPNYTDSSLVLVPNALGPMPTNINGLIDFCLQNVYATPQFLVVDYLDENYEVFCTDTLIFECPPEAECLAFLSDSLVCAPEGYLYTIDFEVPAGSDIPGGIGYIDLNLNPNNLPPGSTISPLGYTFSPKLQPGDQVTLTYVISTPVDLFGDSLCVVITAHDDEEERLCCFAYENCVPFPLCDPCPDVSAEVRPVADDQSEYCCFELFITDTFNLDPNLFTSIETNIITPGVVFDGLATLPAILDGWTPTYDNPTDPREISWNHSSGLVPNNTNYNLFDFCVEGVTSTDSIYLEINWLNQDSVICMDTVAVFCPYCMTVVEDELYCDNNGDYVYQFSFVNNSAFDVNAVSLLDAAASPGVVGNPGVYMLGTTVPVGGTYTGTIPVQLNGNPGDEVCFDIVLRQIIGDDINITCCYATHCVELVPCDELPPLPCEGEVMDERECIDVYDPVCACDGQTYANACYAENAGLNYWTDGPCDDGIFNDGGGILLDAQPSLGGAALSWSLDNDPDSYDFFVLLERLADTEEWIDFALIPANGMAIYNFERLTNGPGGRDYLVLGVNNSGGLEASNEAMVFLQAQQNSTAIYAYPSPVRDVVQVTVNRVGAAQIELISPTGSVDQRQSATFSGAPVRVALDRLQDGVYLIRVRFADGEVVQQRVVRVRE